MRADAVTAMIKAVDGYLIAAILIVFSLGLYELLVSKLDVAEKAEAVPRLLLIRNLDELKDRIVGLVLLVLVIGFSGEPCNYATRAPSICSTSRPASCSLSVLFISLPGNLPEN